MKKAIVTGLVCLASATSMVSEAKAKLAVKDLSWLAGTWHGNFHGKTMEEQFSTPLGEMIVGTSKLADQTGVAFYEFMRIEESEGSLLLTPLPFGQAGVNFKMAESTSSRIVFENQANDFPKKITYELVGERRLKASVEGLQEGRPSIMEFELEKK